MLAVPQVYLYKYQHMFRFYLGWGVVERVAFGGRGLKVGWGEGRVLSNERWYFAITSGVSSFLQRRRIKLLPSTVVVVFF